MLKSRLAFALLTIALVACAPAAGTPAGQAPGGADGSQATPSRTLTIIVGAEPRSLALKALGQAGVTLATSRRLFNGALTIIDAKGARCRTSPSPSPSSTPKAGLSSRTVV